MAKPRFVIDANFWDLDMSSARNLDGCARLIPGQALPLDGARGSRRSRSKQLEFLFGDLRLPLLASLSPSLHQSLSSFCLQSFLFQSRYHKWLIGLIGQCRPVALITSLASQITRGGQFDLPRFKNMARQFLNRSFYSLGLSSEISLNPYTSLWYQVERHGDRDAGFQTKAGIAQEFSNHDVKLEAAWPELFIDREGGYWEMPESISLDMSAFSESGIHYHLGVHKNGDGAHRITETTASLPPSLVPGIWMKAAVAYEMTKDFWRKKLSKKDLYRWSKEGILYARQPNDVLLQEPHSSITSFIGATCSSYYGRSPSGIESTKKPGLVMADLFASFCYSFQRGRFIEEYFDLTRVDARVDVHSAFGFVKNFFRKSSMDSESCPRMSLIFQQQIWGPLVFRADSQCRMELFRGLQLEDYMLSLNYAVPCLESGKVCLWYSPNRREGMVELRLFEP